MAENVGDFVYNKKDLIGHGAFAVVFKGCHKKKDDFVVAIKVITKKNLSKTQSLLAKEIKILKELHHENVVTLFDCQETVNHVYLVMEYCNGGDLADYLHEKGTLSEDTISIFLRQVASAMCALQSKGIVHRDLKPQNLLLSHAGHGNPMPANIRLKIADFGFARFLTGEMMAATLCGSPMYMAPEVIMSKGYDAKADLWSVGTIVYQCLTGKAPFQANSPQALKKFYEKNKNVKPQIPAGTSQQLTDLLFGLLKRNPRDRMDFGEFFNHPFLTGIVSSHKTSTPVAVPSRQRTYSGHRRNSRSPSTSPNCGAEALGDIRVDLLHRMTPPYDVSGTSPSDPPSIINVSTQSPGTAYSKRNLGRAASPSSPQRSGQDDDMGFVMVPLNPDTSEGVHPSRNSSDPLFPLYEAQSPPSSLRGHQISPGSTVADSSPRRATFTIGSPSSSPSTSPRAWDPSFNSPSNSPSSRSPSNLDSKQSIPVPIPGRKLSCPSSPKALMMRDTTNPSVNEPRKITKDGDSSLQTTHVRSSDVPGQRISPQRSDNRVPAIAPPPVRRHTVSMSPKPGALKSAAKALSDQRQGDFDFNSGKEDLRSRLDNDPMLLTKPKSSTIQRALEQISSPPKTSSPVLSALATQTVADVVLPSNSPQPEKQLIKVHSSPAILAMTALPRNKSFLNKTTFQLGSGASARLAPTIFRQNSNPTFSALKVATSPTATLTSSPPTPGTLPTIPGSPTKTSLNHRGGSSTDDVEIKPLRGLFAAASPPSTLQLQGNLIPFGSLPVVGQAPTSSGQPATVIQGTKVTFGFGQNSAFPRSNADCMAGRAQQLEPCSPEMEGPIELVPPELPEDTLMEVEHTEGIRKLNVAVCVVDAIIEVIHSRGAPLISLADSMAIKPNESFLGDHIGFISDECRKTQQLMLYVKALHALNVALQFAKGEMMVGHLKPSNAVKNVVNDLNARYHQCLSKASDLKQHLSRSAQSCNGRTITVSADKLMYAHAMELCQNAALDELFGNPAECKKKYETAQFLLQGLEADTKKDNDRQLLQKYRTAISQRLVYLTKTKPRKTGQCSPR